MIPPGRTQLLLALAALLAVLAIVGRAMHGGGAGPGSGGTTFGSNGRSYGSAASHASGRSFSSGLSAGSHAAGTAGFASVSASGPVVVDVAGAVRAPGVYTLPGTARVRDAIARAGGTLSRADLGGVNRAAHLVDGQQVVVPMRAPPGSLAVVGTGASSTAPSSIQAPVSINSAGAEQLDALDGVGPATAARIVADRLANGPFRTVDDLDRVPGIGPAKLAALRPHLTT